jgi:L-ascorbate metabolism protein UlaG (beta-lactamase superfamily)
MTAHPEHNSSLLTPFKKNNRFYNHEHEKKRTVFSHSIAMFLKAWLKRMVGGSSTVHHSFFTQTLMQSGGVSITWIGHSTFLITINGTTILTDPIFGNASWLFRRIQSPGIPLAYLPSIDYVLLSHNHRDHMDTSSLLHIKKYNPTVLVPLGDKQWFEKRSFAQVHEFGWWQKYEGLKEPRLNFYFLPAYHWSQRAVLDRNRSLWGSWLIEYNNYRIYFAGDTANWHHFEQIARVFPSIDIALLPIGPCEPRAWMQYSHIDAQQAGHAFLTLRAQHLIPMHWGTFYFGLDQAHTPIERLHAWWQQSQEQVKHAQLHIPYHGQKLFFEMPGEQRTIHETVHIHPQL